MKARVADYYKNRQYRLTLWSIMIDYMHIDYQQVYLVSNSDEVNNGANTRDLGNV